MILLDSLVRLGYYRAVVCHYNHRWRGRASGGDARFVRNLARRHGLELETEAAPRGASTGDEAEARKLRYDFFGRVAARRRCNMLLLGHHADDRVETFLHHLVRGGGPAGLLSPRERSSRKLGRRSMELRRPLLRCRRAEIDQAVAIRGLKYREDAGNMDEAHLRNRLRHQLLPTLEAQTGRDPAPALLRTLRILEAEDEFLQSLTPSWTEPHLSTDSLAGLHPALQRRTVHQWLKANRVADVGFREVEAVLQMLDAAKAPARINLAGGRHVRRRSKRLFFDP